MKASLKGRVINLRGDIVKSKKELLAELANLESLEEPVFGVGC